MSTQAADPELSGENEYDDGGDVSEEGGNSRVYYPAALHPTAMGLVRFSPPLLYYVAPLASLGSVLSVGKDASIVSI